MKLSSVFVIGDSISIGYWPYLCEYLKGSFRCLRKKGVKEALWNLNIPMGVNGGDSSLVLNYILNNHIHKEIPKVDCFLFNCGLHDIKTFYFNKKQISLRKYKKNLCLIIKDASKFAKRIFWINSTPIDDIRHNTLFKDFFRYNKDVVKYNNMAEKIMKKYNIPVIDLYSFTLNCGQNIYTDHVHFKKPICKKQAKYIASFLFKEILY